MKRCKGEDRRIEGCEDEGTGPERCSACCLAEMNGSVSADAIRRALPVYFGFSCPLEAHNASRRRTFITLRNDTSAFVSPCVSALTVRISQPQILAKL